MFELILHRRAQRSYNKLDSKTASRVNIAMEALKANPISGKGATRLRGKLEGRYRLRVGDLRIIYRVEREGMLVIVEAIGSRGDIYRR